MVKNVQFDGAPSIPPPGVLGGNNDDSNTSSGLQVFPYNLGSKQTVTPLRVRDTTTNTDYFYSSEINDSPPPACSTIQDPHIAELYLQVQTPGVQFGAVPLTIIDTDSMLEHINWSLQKK